MVHGGAGVRHVRAVAASIMVTLGHGARTGREATVQGAEVRMECVDGGIHICVDCELMLRSIT